MVHRQKLRDTLASGRTLLICGNGGSAAASQHLTGELAGRHDGERHALMDQIEADMERVNARADVRV